MSPDALCGSDVQDATAKAQEGMQETQSKAKETAARAQERVQGTAARAQERASEALSGNKQRVEAAFWLLSVTLGLLGSFILFVPDKARLIDFSLALDLTPHHRLRGA